MQTWCFRAQTLYLSNWHESLQLLMPIQHDIDLGRGAPFRVALRSLRRQHDEQLLAIWRHIVVSLREGMDRLLNAECHGRAQCQTPLRADVNDDEPIQRDRLKKSCLPSGDHTGVRPPVETWYLAPVRGNGWM